MRPHIYTCKYKLGISMRFHNLIVGYRAKQSHMVDNNIEKTKCNPEYPQTFPSVCFQCWLLHRDRGCWSFLSCRLQTDIPHIISHILHMQSSWAEIVITATHNPICRSYDGATDRREQPIALNLFGKCLYTNRGLPRRRGLINIHHFHVSIIVEMIYISEDRSRRHLWWLKPEAIR